MKLEGEYIFNGSREEVWDLVRDPEVLAGALPGTQAMQKISDTEYEGSMNIRVGPVAGSFTGRLVVTDEVPPVSYALAVEGRGAPGFAKGTGAVQLMDQGDGTTLMKYEGDLQIGGKIAGVGQRLIELGGQEHHQPGSGLDEQGAASAPRTCPTGRKSYRCSSRPGRDLSAAFRNTIRCGRC